MCTKNQAIKILGEVYSACKELFQTEIVDAFLYGSYARGDYNKESDVDIFLAVSMDRSDIAKFRYPLAEVTSDLSLKHSVTVSVTVKPYEDFVKYRSAVPFYENVLREGIRYGA